MIFLRRLFCSLLTAAALSWIILCMRWLHVDRGIVRFNHDSTYLFLAWGGVIWLIFLIWVGLAKPEK